ncbi:MAG: hypothetical protein CHACPFDD_01756 [Phycisphaerae bacterium]|nr:hypothetical protein [Phycisphaerae bacterium]
MSKDRTKRNPTIPTTEAGEVASEKKPRKRAGFSVESLEPRILLSATWTDADTGEHHASATDGDDVYHGDSAANAADGLDGDDLLDGNGGNDLLHGGAGDDVLRGDGGADQLFGDDGHDSLSGGSGNDLLHGDAGNDVIRGGSGSDEIDGGDGDDSIRADSGDDHVAGGAGRDVMRGGGGHDEISGGADHDVIYGDGGDDRLAGDDGNDTMRGGSGHDHLAGGAGDDALLGEGGNDTLHGGTGNDLLRGGAGNDHLTGGGGHDTLYGDKGDDTFSFDGAQDGDIYRVSGGSGNDTIDLSHVHSSQVDVAAGRLDVHADDGTSFTIHHSQIENVQFSDGVVHAPTHASNVSMQAAADAHEAQQAASEDHQHETNGTDTGDDAPDSDSAELNTDDVHNSVPLADAGQDVSTVEGQTVTLHAEGSHDPDAGDQLTYEWVQTGGPQVSLSDVHAANPTFQAPNVTADTPITFELRVSDGTHTSVDDVTVNIAGMNDAPVADAGADQYVHEGSTVVLNAAGSHDADEGDTLSYEWRQVGGPVVALSDTHQASPTFTAPDTTGISKLTFEVSVTDASGATHVDTVEVAVGDPQVESFVHGLNYTQFRDLSADQVDYLTPQQVATIPNSDWFATMSADARASLDEAQVQALNTASVSIGHLTAEQREWLTDGQIQDLGYTQFRYLDAEGVDHLTPAQVATIPNSDWFATMSAEARASLDEAQVQALNTTSVSIGHLTAEQREWLTADQIQDLGYTQFRYLDAEGVDHLTPAQVATIPNSDWFATMSAEARASLDEAQVQALNTTSVSIGHLTAEQREWLTADQIQDLGYTQFRYLDAEGVDHLTPAQVATIPNSDWFATMSAEARASLDEAQVQALNTTSVSIGHLTAEQREWLTDGQIQQLGYTQFRYLDAEGVDHLTPAQVATIPNSDWFATMSAEARASLDEAQVQALNTASVSIGHLTAEQREWLTDGQIQQLGYTQFRYLDAEGVDHLTPAQVATIPNSDWLATMSAEARASLDEAQVQALNTTSVSIGHLTAEQREWLTDGQIQKLGYTQFRYVPADRMADLTAAQIASIPNTSWFNTLSAGQKEGLTHDQIRALGSGLTGVTFLGGAGDETLTGNSNVNNMRGGAGDDVLTGSAGKDVLDGGAGSDTLDGGTGNDLLIGGGGNDQMRGGFGDDAFRFENPSDGDVYTVDGGDDRDMIDLSAYPPESVHVSPGTIVVDLPEGGSFTINHTNIEAVQLDDGQHAVSYDLPDEDAAPDVPTEDSEPTDATPNDGGATDADDDQEGTTDLGPQDGGTTDVTPHDGGTANDTPHQGGTTDVDSHDGGTTDVIPESGGTSGQTPHDAAPESPSAPDQPVAPTPGGPTSQVDPTPSDTPTAPPSTPTVVPAATNAPPHAGQPSSDVAPFGGSTVEGAEPGATETVQRMTRFSADSIAAAASHTSFAGGDAHSDWDGSEELRVLDPSAIGDGNEPVETADGPVGTFDRVPDLSEPAPRGSGAFLETQAIELPTRPAEAAFSMPRDTVGQSFEQVFASPEPDVVLAGRRVPAAQDESASPTDAPDASRHDAVAVAEPATLSSVERSGGLLAQLWGLLRGLTGTARPASTDNAERERRR